MLTSGVHILAHSGDTEQPTETMSEQQKLVLNTHRPQIHEVNLDLEQTLLEITPRGP